MTPEIIGKISGLLIAINVIPYAIRTYQRKIEPNLTSFSLWTLNGLVLLLTYNSIGAEENIWPVVFAFVNPLLITILLLSRRDKWKSFTRLDKTCLALGLLALIVWFSVHDNKELSLIALLIALIADVFASVPTISFVWQYPDKDRPFSWIVYTIGFGLAIFAVTDHNVANYILPIYMIVIGVLVSFPLVKYRLQHKIPLSEWI